MERVAIKKTYVLWGQNDGELEHRIDTLRQAIGEQEGSIIDIEWVALPAQHGASASILYEVPLRRGVRRGRVGCSPTAAGE